MSGTKGHSGGVRPGSGPKPQAVRDSQTLNRTIMLSVITPEDIMAIARAMVGRAKSGDEKAFRALMAYVLGAPDSELTLRGDASAPLRVEVHYVDATDSVDEDEDDELDAPVAPRFALAPVE